MTDEHTIQNAIVVAVNKHNCHVFRTNVGKVLTIDHRLFSTGLPVGFPDLTGFKHDNGKIFFIECKNEVGVPRKEQILFHKMLVQYHIIHGIARNVNDALKIIDNELVGYGFK